MIIKNENHLDNWQRIEVRNDLDDDGDAALSFFVHDERMGEDVYLTAAGRQNLRDALAKFDGVETQTTVEPSGQSYNEDAIALAVAYERQITFQYQKAGSNVIETRSMLPTQVIDSKDDHKIVVGYDQARENPRAFRLDRILGAVTISA